MRNLKITIEYDGTNFVGWQRQTHGRSVQEEIETALQKLCNEPITITGAGRTDSGVHARGQVANFKTTSSFPNEKFLYSLNSILPEDITLKNIEEVPLEFSARYSAKERLYHYHISLAKTSIERMYCWQVHYPLNFELINIATQILLSTQDFQSFCKVESEVEHYRCSIIKAEWEKLENSRWIFKISANRFLHGMVRAIVGTLIDVGRGYTTIEQFHFIIDSRNRQNAGMAAPPHGLFLMEVKY